MSEVNRRDARYKTIIMFVSQELRSANAFCLCGLFVANSS